MNWISLTSAEDYHQAIKESNSNVIGIFKHSTRCAISAVAKKRLESKFKRFPEETKIYLLDLLSNRELSNLISKDLKIPHQSPQLIIVKEENALEQSSHLSINSDSILKYS